MTDRDTENLLWKQYWIDKSDANRNAIVEFYREWITQVARLETIDRGNRQCIDDIVADVLLMAIYAIPAFRLAKGTSFRSFIRSRIKGIVIDHIRSLNSMSRKWKDIEDGRITLSHTLGRNPTEAELAGYLGISELRVTRCVADHHATRKGECAVDYGTLKGECRNDESQSVTADFMRLTDGLDAKKIRALWLVYFEKMKVAQVACALGLSHKETSRLLKDARNMLLQNRTR
jgi:RNA polymerase sigma factor (sigma-70 family)